MNEFDEVNEYGIKDRRLECLKLAQTAEDTGQRPAYISRSLVLARAQEYAAFVNGLPAEVATSDMPTRLNDPAATNEAPAPYLEAGTGGEGFPSVDAPAPFLEAGNGGVEA